MNALTQITLQTQVPEALTPRETSFNWILGIVLFASLMILAIARARQANVYYAVSVGLIKTQSVRVFFREIMPVRSGASMLLLLNYCVSSGLLVYLMAEHLGFDLLVSRIMALTVPVGLLFFHFFSLVFSGWVTGEMEVFRIPIIMKIVGTQALGIVYFVAATIWILQPDYVDITFQVVIWIFLVETAFRILKSVSVVLRQGVTWYYIILYFCTLEILPFLVVFYYASQNLEV
ncbi:MAG: hypothetical protein DCO96_00630 [Fluviicola sp. XM-24bin1]|nr:MAG: hypothetical protein DCO96_00630 [Fluviicola sp. XM-24bin1]